MSMFRSRIPGVSSKALAHNNVMQSLVGNKELKELQDMVTAEKAVIASVQKLAVDISKASECMKAWGTGEGDDLADIFMHSNTLLQHISSSLVRYAQHEETIRTYMKAIRTREEHLDEIKRRRRGVGIKADGAEKKLSRMSEENKHLEAQRILLNQLREEMKQLDHDIMVEEAALSDYKRTTSKDWMLLKFGGLLEHAQKAVQAGQAGKALIEEIPLAITTPGYGRAPYGGHQRTEAIISDCSRVIESISFQPVTSVAYPAYGHPSQPHQPLPDPNIGPPHAYANGSNSFQPPQPQQYPQTTPNVPPGYGGLPPGSMPHAVPPAQSPAHSATFSGLGSAPTSQNGGFGEFGQYVPPQHSQTVGPSRGATTFQLEPLSFQNAPPSNPEQNQASRFGTFSGAGPDTSLNRLDNNASPALPAPPPKDIIPPATQSGFAPSVSSPTENPWSGTTPTGPAPAEAPPSVTNNLPPATSGHPLPRPTSSGSMSDGSSMVLAYYNSYGDDSAPATASVQDSAPRYSASSAREPAPPMANVSEMQEEDTHDAYADDAFSVHKTTSPSRTEFKVQEASTASASADKRASASSKGPDAVREADAAAAREIGRELGILATTSTSGSITANPPPRTSSRHRQQTLPVYTPTSGPPTTASAASSNPTTSTSPYGLPSFSALPSLSLSFGPSEPFSADFQSLSFSPITAKPSGPPEPMPSTQQDAGSRMPSSESHAKSPSIGGNVSIKSQSLPKSNIAMATFDPNVIPTPAVVSPSPPQAPEPEPVPVSPPVPAPVPAPASIASPPGALGSDRKLTPSPAASLGSVSGESVLPPPPKLPFVSMSSSTARTSSSMPGSPKLGVSALPSGDGPRTISAAAFRRRPLPKPTSSGEALDAGNTAGVGIGTPVVSPLQVRKKPPVDGGEAPPLESNPSYTSTASGYGSTPYVSAPTTPDREGPGISGEGGGHGYQPSPLAVPGNQQQYHSPTSEFSHNSHPPTPSQNQAYSQPANPPYSPYPPQQLPPYQYQQQGPGYPDPSQSPRVGAGSPHTFSSGYSSPGEQVGVAIGSPSTGYDGYGGYPTHADNRQTIGEHGWKQMGYPQYAQAGTPNDQQQQSFQQQQGGRGGYESGRFNTSLQ